MVYSLVSMYFDSPQLGIQKNKLSKLLDYWSSDMFNFDFLEKGLGIVIPLRFAYDYFTKNISHVIF